MLGHAASSIWSLNQSGGLIATAAVVAVAVSLVTLCMCRLFFARMVKGRVVSTLGLLLASALGVAFPATVTGYISGFSREPAVSAVVPAVLTLFGGLTIYVISKRRSATALATNALIVFSLCFLFAIEYGSYLRVATVVQQATQRAVQEYEVRMFRENLGLPSDPNTELLDVN